MDKMKYAIVLPDGAADDPLPELGGRTPLEAARIPRMDSVARRGCIGRIVTVPAGFTPATDVATLSLMGYDPHRCYTGRAPLEAIAQRLVVRPDQLIFRCNFVTLEGGRMADFTAGHIGQPDADALCAALGADAELAGRGCTFHPGVSYRNLMLAANAASWTLRCTPPHDIPDQPVDGHLPSGDGAAEARAIMRRAAAVLAGNPVNARRRTEGTAAATDIWLWGQGRPTVLASFAERFGLRGVVITGVDIIRGLGLGMGMELCAVPGATGYIDTNFAGKGEAAVRALEEHDLVVVHVEAADEAGHLGDAAEKVRSLERIDELIVGPLLAALARRPAWRILVAPDHPTPVGTKAHSATPPLYCYAGSDVAGGSGRRFTEAEATASGVWIDPGTALMSEFLGRTARG
jgi:2,3-bisphosphoglycerate-independent phosphoglycerate mutase